jgi:hypothetical protein
MQEAGTVLVATYIFTRHADGRVRQIDALYECCSLFYKKEGDDASTVSCPKASLLRYVLAHIRDSCWLPVPSDRV